MFIYNFKENKLPNIADLKANIETEAFVLENQIKTTAEKQESIYKSFIDLSIRTYLNFENASILKDFNNAFSSVSELSGKLKAQKLRLETIKSFINSTEFDNENFNQDEFLKNFQDLLEDYYGYKNQTQIEIVQKNKKINKLLKALEKCNSITSKSENKNQNQKQKYKNKAQKEQTKKEQSKQPNPIFKPITQETNSNRLLDNRSLIISEKDKKVYLPYLVSDLQEDIQKTDYDSFEELIENNYIIPLKRFRNPSVSRFKEGFRLMREKEYESFGASFSLGMKLMHNYKLHPAVITACRNVDELKCFLDCLDEDIVDSFDIFDIQYDIPPIKK